MTDTTVPTEPSGPRPTHSSCIDIYWEPVDCDTNFEPCLNGSLLYSGNPCEADSPTVADFCIVNPSHWVCATQVEVGTPPTLPPDTSLPATGFSAVLPLALGLVLVALGGTARRAVRR